MSNKFNNNAEHDTNKIFLGQNPELKRTGSAALKEKSICLEKKMSYDSVGECVR